MLKIISYEVKGKASLIKNLNATVNAFKDPEPFHRMGKHYLKWIKANFADKGQTFGEPWPPLSPVTIKIKRKLYEQGKSRAIQHPLIRTGALEKSFRYNIKDRRTIEIYSTKDYAEKHQKGGKVKYKGQWRSVPRRVLAVLDGKREEKLEKIFDTWIKQLLKKQGFVVKRDGGDWKTVS